MIVILFPQDLWKHIFIGGIVVYVSQKWKEYISKFQHNHCLNNLLAMVWLFNHCFSFYWPFNGKRKVGVRIPAATDLKLSIVKTGSDSSSAERSAIGVSVPSLGDDHYKQMWNSMCGTPKNPHCSPYEWKILE